jgi:hypothetical protein
MEACGMSDDAAPNARHSKPSLREMLRQAVANTANLKITKCVRGTTSIQENAGFAAIRAKSSRAADRFAASLKPVIAEIRTKGAKSQTAIAKELNNLGHRTQKGSQWDSNGVGALLGRQAALDRRSDSASVGQKVI